MFDTAEQRLIELAAANQATAHNRAATERNRANSKARMEERKERRRQRMMGGVQMGLGALAAGASFIPGFAPFTAPIAGSMLGGGADSLSGGRLPGLAGAGAMVGNAIGQSSASLYGGEPGALGRTATGPTASGSGGGLKVGIDQGKVPMRSPAKPLGDFAARNRGFA